MKGINKANVNWTCLKDVLKDQTRTEFLQQARSVAETKPVGHTGE
jgi:hypothetical protein